MALNCAFASATLNAPMIPPNDYLDGHIVTWHFKLRRAQHQWKRCWNKFTNSAIGGHPGAKMGNYIFNWTTKPTGLGRFFIGRNPYLIPLESECPCWPNRPNTQGR